MLKHFFWLIISYLSSSRVLCYVLICDRLAYCATKTSRSLIILSSTIAENINGSSVVLGWLTRSKWMQKRGVWTRFNLGNWLIFYYYLRIWKTFLSNGKHGSLKDMLSNSRDLSVQKRADEVHRSLQRSSYAQWNRYQGSQGLTYILRLQNSLQKICKTVRSSLSQTNL